LVRRHQSLESGIRAQVGEPRRGEDLFEAEILSQKFGQQGQGAVALTCVLEDVRREELDVEVVRRQLERLLDRPSVGGRRLAFALNRASRSGR
jgi:hypothetical protein